MIVADDSGFAIDLSAPDAKLCVVVPAPLFDAASCPGVDPEPTRKLVARMQTPQKTAIVVATVRHATFSYDVMALRQTYGRAGAMTPQQLDGWIRAACNGVRDKIHHDVAAKAFDGGAAKPQEIKGMNAVQMIIAPEGADAPPIRVVTSSFFADDVIVTLSYVTDASHVDEVRVDAERFAQTVDWPSARASHDKGAFAVSRDRAALGWLQPAILVGFALFAVWLWLRMRRRPLGRNVHAQIGRDRDDEKPKDA